MIFQRTRIHLGTEKSEKKHNDQTWIFFITLQELIATLIKMLERKHALIYVFLLRSVRVDISVETSCANAEGVVPILDMNHAAVVTTA